MQRASSEDRIINAPWSCFSKPNMWPPCSIYERGVTAFIRHFSALSKSSSILWIVRGSNACSASPTYKHKIRAPFSNTSRSHSDIQFIITIITWRARSRGTWRSSILAARDKQATDASCIAHDFHCCEHKTFKLFTTILNGRSFERWYVYKCFSHTDRTQKYEKLLSTT